MAQLIDITHYLDEYLEIEKIKDLAWNGLQFEGKKEINKIAIAVDAGIEVFDRAHELNADMLLVHHGIFWHKVNPSIAGWHKKRIDKLYEYNFSLYGAHLPLDRHEAVGNNVELLKLVGAKVTEPFAIFGGINVGWIGELAKPIMLPELVAKLSQELNTECTVLPFGRETISSVAVCSGGGGYATFYEALDQYVDLYITGDSIEVYQTAKDARMNVIFAGHYATETLGVKALAKLLAKRFNVETVFIDMPTGL